MCFYVFKWFGVNLKLNRLPQWNEQRERKTKDESCYATENNSTSEKIESKLDCYEQINNAEHILENLHLWLGSSMIITGNLTSCIVYCGNS